MPINGSKRAKMTGKGASPSFVQLPHFLLRSREFIELDPHAKSLMLYMASKYNGHNNGDFACPVNRYKEAGFKSPATLQKARRTLIESRWAVVTRQGQRRRCSLYGLTIWPIDDCDGKIEWPSERKASHSWKTQSDRHLLSQKVDACCPITFKEGG